MRPQLSIVVPVYGNWWMTRRLLHALEPLRDGGVPFETIVVDNASRDETPDAIGAFGWVRYERLDRNLNFAGGCNAGARAAEAPLVLFLNNDAYPLADALPPLVGAFEGDDVAIAGGALFFEDGVTQSAGLVLLPNAHWHFASRNLPAALPFVNRSRDALAVSGAAMAVRRQWFLDAGGFDESYANGFEDVDLCLRARRDGLSIAYVADARFAHYEGASAGRYDRELQNERRFYAAWAAALGGLPRMQRGSVGAVILRTAEGAPALEAAALHDLSVALRSFGHPVLHKAPSMLQRFDRRMRHTAELAWLVPPHQTTAGVALQCNGAAQLRSRGAVDLCVAWLPCADPSRTARLPIRDCAEEPCATLAVAGFSGLSTARRDEVAAALDAWLNAQSDARAVVFGTNPADVELAARYGARATVLDLLQTDAPPLRVVGVLQLGFTDAAAFGNALLAQAELATLVLEGETAAALLAADVVARVRPQDIAAKIAAWQKDPADRKRYARWGAADARRRFSPRRSAIRVVDLLCAARFGLEREGVAVSNTPLHLSR